MYTGELGKFVKAEEAKKALSYILKRRNRLCTMRH